MVAPFPFTLELRYALFASIDDAAEVVTLGAVAQLLVVTSADEAESVEPVALFALILYLYVVPQVRPVLLTPLV